MLVVQAQALLRIRHPSTFAIPLTTNVVEKAEPLRLRVPPAGRLSRASDLLVDQLRGIDSRRLIKRPLGRLTADLMARVEEAVCEVLDSN